MYRDGLGTEQDLDKCIDLFLKAGEQGNIGCIHNVMSMTWSGDHKNENTYQMALGMMERFANGGNQDAISKLGNTYHDGTISVLDHRRSFEWYQKGAELGNMWCRQRLGEMTRQ